MLKNSLIMLLLICLSPAVFADTSETKERENYDEALAAEIGADEYGMKTYIFVTLLTGETTIDDEQESREIFAGHFSNMSRLANEGKLVLAGPVIEARPKRGIFILNVDSIEEAEALVQTDPAVEAGVFKYEMFKLYGSAALMKINDIHSTIQKTRIE